MKFSQAKACCTETQLQQKAERYCASAERCEQDVLLKLCHWGATPETEARIVAHLYRERYLDTARYCKAFVRDKYRLSKWGRDKIAMHLRMKHLPAEDIASALEEIDTDEYDETLAHILRQKARTLKAASEYERNAKLIRFALGRGYAMKEILRQLKTKDFDEYME